MTLPSSGSITTAQIAAEVGGYPFSIPSTPIRNLTGRAAGSITMPDDFYGQTGGGDCSEAGPIDQVTTVGGLATHAGVLFGATAWNRRIFCLVHWCSVTDATEAIITAATIGGVAATIHVQTGEGGTSAASNYGCAIISATVPTGTSGSVTVSYSPNSVRASYVTPERVTGLVSASASDTGVGFDEHLFGAGTLSASADLNVPGNGLAFFAATASSDGVINNISTTGINERAEQLADPDGRISNGFTTGLGSQAGRPVDTSCTVSVTGRLRLVTASFQLA